MKESTKKTCSFDGCDRPSQARTLCRAHYKQSRGSGILRPIGRPRGPTVEAPEVCSVEGCGRNHSARGYCMGHYMQHRRGRPLTPIGRQGSNGAVFREREAKRPIAEVRATTAGGIPARQRPLNGHRNQGGGKTPSYVTKSQRQADAEREAAMLAAVERSHIEQRAAVLRGIGRGP